MPNFENNKRLLGLKSVISNLFKVLSFHIFFVALGDEH